MSNYTWGQQWPDGSEIKLAAGMLVLLDNGAWDVITAIYDEGEYPGDHRFIAIETSDLVYDEYDGAYIPLAPAPTPGGLAELRRELYRTGNCISDLELGEIIWPDIRDRPDYMMRSSCPLIPAEELPAHMRDMQKFGALLAYTQQEGW